MNFSDAEAASHDEIADEFGEPWRFVPMKSRPNYSPVPDPDRGVVLVCNAIYTGEAKNVPLKTEETGVSTRKPCLTIQKADMPRRMKTGDQWHRCSTGEMFEITDIEPDTMSGVEITLTQLGRAKR